MVDRCQLMRGTLEGSIVKIISMKETYLMFENELTLLKKENNTQSFTVASDDWKTFYSFK